MKTKKGIAIIAALVIGIGIILYQIRCNETQRIIFMKSARKLMLTKFRIIVRMKQPI